MSGFVLCSGQQSCSRGGLMEKQAPPLSQPGGGTGSQSGDGSGLSAVLPPLRSRHEPVKACVFVH